MCCGGFPYPLSSKEFAADTLAAGADLGLVIIDTSVSIASPVCARASSFTSAATLGLPPGLPLWPFLNGFPIVMLFLTVMSAWYDPRPTTRSLLRTSVRLEGQYHRWGIISAALGSLL